jgi:hypothetical protein
LRGQPDGDHTALDVGLWLDEPERSGGDLRKVERDRSAPSFLIMEWSKPG